jgi:magnesium transporter
VEDFRNLLSNILNANVTLVGVRQTDVGIRQNEQTKKMSAWGAILLVPTLIAGIYGMNFKIMPEMEYWFGHPLALSLMVLVSMLLYLRFNRIDWL